MFKDFGKRLQRDVKRLVDLRMQSNLNNLKRIGEPAPQPIDVNVISHAMQRYAVWFGGSMLASSVCFLPIPHPPPPPLTPPVSTHACHPFV